jgi:SnoaL-like domain
MTPLPGCFASLLAAWNEYDPDRMRGLVEAALTEDVAFTDPNYQIVGIDAFIDQVHEFRAKVGQVKLVTTSGIDLHHDRARYSWAILFADGKRFEGFDAVALDLAQGKIKRIDGFFGPLPPVSAVNPSAAKA